MQRQRTGVIAYIGDAFREVDASRYWAELVRGVQFEAMAHGLQIMPIPYDHDLDLDLMDKVDGVVLGITQGSFKLFQPMLPQNGPCVSIVLPYAGYSAVIFDNSGGGEMATDHLISLGHRRIAFLMELDNPHDTFSIGYRLDGYKAALRRNGLPFDPELIIDPKVPNIDASGSKDIFYYQGRTVARERFKGPADSERPTAIFAQNDPLAMGVIDGLKELGVRVPEDISVVGFDGVESYESIQLTTIEVPIYDMGMVVIQALAKQIEAHQQGRLIQTEEIKLPVKLRVGGTTAAL